MTHALVATFENNYKHAILQIMLGVLVTMLLQLLCVKGMNLISWIIVFIPFIFYTYMIIIIYHVFGLNPKSNDAEDDDKHDEEEDDK